MSTDIEIVQVAEGVWSVAGGDYRTIFASNGRDVVAVNGFGSADLSDAYLEAIRETVPGARIAAVVASIDHLDHSGRASALADGGEFVAHELCARMLKSRGQQVTRRLARDGEELELGGIRLSMSYPGPSQGTGNLAIHLPDQRVLFLVGPRADARYGLFPDVHVRHVSRVWRQLAELDADVVVPGRGPLTDRSGVLRAADYVDALAVTSQEAFAAGVPFWLIEGIGPFVEEALRDRFGDLDGFDRHAAIGSIRIVHHYLMGGWGLEDTAHPEQLLATGGVQSPD